MNKKTDYFMGTMEQPQIPNFSISASEYVDIQQAVDACANAGGGTVVVPEGKWHTGALRLHSRIRLHLEDGARIVFSTKREDYLPVVFTRWEGKECYNYSPLIYANGCENVAITGNGTVVGNGEDWWPWLKMQRPASRELTEAEYHKIPVEKRVYGTEEAALRPSFIQFIHCKNLLIEGITILDGPMWTIHPVYCENLVVSHVKVFTKGPNTDGLNPDSCKNVLIEGCHFDTGDDCIAINAGMNEDGWRVGRPSENIEIRDCVMTGGHGAVVIGSAMSGGVRNIYAHDCKADGTMWGIRLKSMEGRGGYVDGVRFENFELNHIERQAIQITMFYEYALMPGRTDAKADFRNIEIRNVYGKNAEVGMLVKGFPEQRLKNITLDHIHLTAKNAYLMSDVENIVMNDVVIESQEA